MNRPAEKQTGGHRMAIVHDFLIQMGGAENVVEQVALAYPESEIYTSATFGENLYSVFKTERVRNTWMQRLPGMRKHHKKFFFLYPFAFRSLRIKNADLAWISSTAFSKWIPKPEGMRFVCYCHTPPRYFWNPNEYLENEISNPLLRRFVKMLVPIFRESDRRQSRKIDLFLANSKNVQERIKRCYDRDSIVVFPPVDIDRFQVSRRSEDFFLIVSRLVGYKRVDLAVEAFTETGRKLVVVGDGPDRKRLESLAGENVEFLGRAPDDTVTELMATCRGFVFPGCEDFGITPVEAQACGKPIVAYRGGGALETVVEGETGVFFDEPTADSLAGALDEFDWIDWDVATIRRNAERFSTEAFLRRTREVLDEFLESGAVDENVATSESPTPPEPLEAI